MRSLSGVLQKTFVPDYKVHLNEYFFGTNTTFRKLTLIKVEFLYDTF